MNLKQRVSVAVIALAVPVVVHFEGTYYSTYKDPIGIVTSCTGHTGPELKMGQKFTKAECAATLRDDLIKHSAALDCVPDTLADNVKAAFLSFAFNAGVKAFCGSTAARKANMGDIAGACRELLRWTYAGGRELAGLVRRRQAEYALCMGVQ